MWTSLSKLCPSNERQRWASSRERKRKIKCSLTNINSLKSRTVLLGRRCRATACGVGTCLNISNTNNVAFFFSSPEISSKLLLLCLILWSVAPTRKTSPAPTGCQQISASSSKFVSILLFCMFLWMVCYVFPVTTLRNLQTELYLRSRK